MSFDKAKAMRSAEKFLTQGKIRAAIGEYKRIVENDSKDYSTLNVLGDLYVKEGESSEAVVCYTRVAEHYSKQGFAQKAIAIYNKIQRLHPNSSEVSAKLAKLYQQKGSFAEARSHYVQLAEQFQSKGQKTEALEIWKQIAELDPYNTDVYLKIAETCWQDGNKDEAAKAFTEAGNRLARQNQTESALTSFSRALEIRPYDLNALNGYVSAQVKLGFAEDAAKHLEQILEQNPYNREILYLLVDCYIECSNAPEAERAVVRLVEQEPANYPKFLDLVDLYVRVGDLDSAVRILSMSSEHLLVGGKSAEFLKWTEEILTRNPEQVDALRLLVRYHGWQRDESELRGALQRLAEVAEQQGAADEEHYALSQLVMIMPHEVRYAQRLQELNQERGHHGLADLGQNFFGSESKAEIPRIENEGEFVGGSVVEENLDGDYSDYVGDVAVSESDEFVYAESEMGFAFAPSSDEGSSADEEQSMPELRPADELRIDQELESIRFYISQGYFDLADKTLEGLEIEFGPLPQFATVRSTIPVDGEEEKPAVTAANVADENDQATPEDDAVAADSAEMSVAGDVPEAAEESTEAAQADESQTQLSATDAGEALEDLSATASEMADFSAPEPESTVETTAEPSDEQAQEFNFLDDFRSELGLEDSEPASDGDFETHYQMATAYKEMGLMEEAIREFQDAVNLVKSDDGTRRFFQCCNLLGLCFMEQGMPNLALIWYRRALDTPNLNDEEEQALLYETAIAYEMGGEMPKAVQCFEQIYAVNVDYRDVSSRLEQLRVNNFAM